jgi:hypothetical protein
MPSHPTLETVLAVPGWPECGRKTLPSRWRRRQEIRGFIMLGGPCLPTTGHNGRCAIILHALAACGGQNIIANPSHSGHLKPSWGDRIPASMTMPDRPSDVKSSTSGPPPGSPFALVDSFYFYFYLFVYLLVNLELARTHLSSQGRQGPVLGTACSSGGGHSAQIGNSRRPGAEHCTVGQLSPATA